MAALAIATNELNGPKTTPLSLSCNSFQFCDPFSEIVRNAPIAPPGEPLKSLIQFQFHKLFTKTLPVPSSLRFSFILIEVSAPHRLPLFVRPLSRSEADQINESWPKSGSFPINHRDHLLAIPSAQHDVPPEILAVDYGPRQRAQPFDAAHVVFERLTDQPAILQFQTREHLLNAFRAAPIMLLVVHRKEACQGVRQTSASCMKAGSPLRSGNPTRKVPALAQPGGSGVL